MRVSKNSTPTINNQPKVRTENSSASTGIARESKATENTFQRNRAKCSLQQSPLTEKGGLQRSIGTEASCTTTTRQASPSNRGSRNPVSTPAQTKTPGATPRETTPPASSMSIDGSQEATTIAADLQAGRITGEQAIQRAEQHVETMRANGADPASIQHFYRQLATDTYESSATVNNEGGQCYQDGKVEGETPGHVFQTSAYEAFARRANQATIESRMTEALGRPVDPSNLSDVRDYMEHVAAEGGHEAVQRELGQYLDTFYTHGHSVEYPNWTNPGTSAETIGEDARYDGGNRRIIDCDGFASIAHQVTNGIQGGRYNTRFAHMSGEDGGHAMLTVEDTQEGRGFVVNNNDTSTDYTFPPNGDASAAARQGVLDSMSDWDPALDITSEGLGLGPDLDAAYDNHSPVN